MTQILWDNAPLPKPITAVDAGAIVLVRIWPSDPSVGALIPDDLGVPPHMIFRADIAPRGTTAFVSTSLFGAVAELGERPTSNITQGLITDGVNIENIDFDLDLGLAFQAPVSGTIILTGGKWAGGVNPYQVNIQTIMPQSVDLEMPFTNYIGDRRVVSRQTGGSGAVATMTYYGVTPTPIPVPRGAVSVVTPAAADLTFTLGNSPHGAVNVVTPAGLPLALGYLSQGTFGATGGHPDISWVSFKIEVG